MEKGSASGVVEFEEENEFGMQAAGSKGGEIELGMGCEGMFQGKSLDRLKRVGKGVEEGSHIIF